jgi:hypothetical protein
MKHPVYIYSHTHTHNVTDEQLAKADDIFVFSRSRREDFPRDVFHGFSRNFQL